MPQLQDPQSGPEMEALLRPTLSASEPAMPLFSVRANFFVAFIGGVYAAATFAMLNAMRMHRLRQDGWIAALVVVGWTTFLVWAGRVMVSSAVPEWMHWLGNPGSTVRRLGSIVGLVLFGLFYWRRRAVYRAQVFNAVDPPNPWPAGLGAVGASIVITWLVVFLSADG